MQMADAKVSGRMVWQAPSMEWGVKPSRAYPKSVDAMPSVRSVDVDVMSSGRTKM